MKKKVEAIIVERNDNGKVSVAFFRGNNRMPKSYHPATETSVHRITMFIWHNEDKFRFTPYFLKKHTGWLATLTAETD